MVPHSRPRRHTREHLQHFLRCPLCWGDGDHQAQDPNPEQVKHPRALRVIAFRNRGARLECPACGLRFTVPVAGVGGLAEALRAPEIDLRNETSIEQMTSVDVSSVDFDDVDYPVEVRKLIAEQLVDEHERACASQSPP